MTLFAYWLAWAWELKNPTELAWSVIIFTNAWFLNSKGSIHQVCMFHFKPLRYQSTTMITISTKMWRPLPTTGTTTTTRTTTLLGKSSCTQKKKQPLGNPDQMFLDYQTDVSTENEILRKYSKYWYLSKVLFFPDWIPISLKTKRECEKKE